MINKMVWAIAITISAINTGRSSLLLTIDLKKLNTLCSRLVKGAHWDVSKPTNRPYLRLTSYPQAIGSIVQEVEFWETIGAK